MTKELKFTLFLKAVADGIATKTIKLGSDGKPNSDASACGLTRGDAKLVDLNLSDLANVLNNCEAETAIAVGALTALAQSRANSKGYVPVVTKRQLSSNPNAIARSRDFLEFVPGQSAAMVLDYDQKGMPQSVRDIIKTHGDFWKTMIATFPMLEKVARVERASTSSGLYRTDTGEVFPDSGGCHVYLEAQDGADIPRALEACAKRLWLADMGWIYVSDGGAALLRSLVDSSVAQPERLFFEGPPETIAPLAQDLTKRTAVYHAGGVLDTRACFPDLSHAEQIAYDAKVAEAKETEKDTLSKVRAVANERAARDIVARTNVPFLTALKAASRRFKYELAPETILHFDDTAIGSVTVSSVLSDPDKFLDETLADPIEPNYGGGRCKALVMRGHRDGQILVHSFAHGSFVFRLLYDENAIRAVVNRAPVDKAVTVFFSCLDNAVDNDIIFERLKDEVSRHAGVKVSALNAERGKHAERRHREWTEKKNAEARRKDTRPYLPCPTKGAEKLKALGPIDALLAKVAVSRPPLRNLSGSLVRVEEKSVATLHELVSQTEATALQAAGKEPLPAPQELLLKTLSPTGVSMLVEEHVALVAVNGAGEESHVSLPPEFCLALMEMPNSAVPVCAAIQTLPLVLPGRRLLSAQGYNSERRLLMQIEPALYDILPEPKDCTVAAAKEAYAFLCNEWLCDVQTDAEGLATVVAVACQMIERVLLDQRPNVFINGSMSGGGKTTLANMLTAAVYGRRAAAAAWTDNKEERKKALFSWLLDGVACIVFDNIKRGERINCEVLDKIATSSEYADRVLGSTKTGTASTCTTVILTGNCIEPRGDARNRSLVIDIASSCAKPEARSFKHEDVVGWTIVKRADILKALYTILLVERPDVANKTTRTRFKTWYRLCAEPVEIVSGVDLVAVFERNDEGDEETASATYLLERLHAAFGDKSFNARDVAALMDASHGIDDPHSEVARASYDMRAEAADRLRDALEAAVPPAFHPGGLPDAKRVGHKLRSLKGYTVETENATLRLSMRPHQKTNATYRVVDVSTRHTPAVAT